MLGKMFFSQKLAQVNIQLTVLEAEEDDILYKVMVKAKVEKTISKTRAIFKEEGIFKEEETVKEEGIFKEEEIVKAEAIFKEIVKVEDKLQTRVKTEAEDIIQAEEDISVNFFVEYVTKLVIMKKIVELPLIKFPSFIKTKHSLQMTEMMMV
jgi:hypothetical protein